MALALAQLQPPNAAGVTMGHLHIKSRDVEAQRRLWIGALGGTPAKLGPMEVAKLPGVLVLYQKGEPAAGTVGSVINHVGFTVRDLKGTLAKMREAGVTVETETPSNAFLLGPDGLRLELLEDKALATPVALHHIHFFDTEVDATKAWYVKTFDAVGGQRSGFQAADLPGVNLTFGLSNEGATAGTKGRVLDHIGFEVKNLEAFTKKLEAAGVKFDVPYRKVPSIGLAIAFFTDPWGTYIELTEGLDKL
jgi:catechol 2,3-dioxygenase-like lactoylglutathione lyase family enzyme